MNELTEKVQIIKKYMLFKFLKTHFVYDFKDDSLPEFIWLIEKC